MKDPVQDVSHQMIYNLNLPRRYVRPSVQPPDEDASLYPGGTCSVRSQPGLPLSLSTETFQKRSDSEHIGAHRRLNLFKLELRALLAPDC